MLIMLEIDDDFFDRHRKLGTGFYQIKDWKKDNYSSVIISDH